jgi:OOP family OmpA-OmpF porin
MGKSEYIKSDLITKVDSAYTTNHMGWVHPSIKGDDLELTRVVTLKGTAPSEALKNEAESIARGLKGIDGVDNQLLVQEVEVVEKVAEVSVEEPVKEDIEEEKPSIPSPYEIMVSKSEDAKIVLQGYVPNQEVHNTLVEKATTLFGKDQVSDELKESEGAPTKWADSVMLGLDKLDVVDYGKFKIVDDAFTFKGHVGEVSKKESLLQSFSEALDSNYKGEYDIDAPEPKVVVEPKAVFSCQEEFKKVLLSQKINFEYNKADIKTDSYTLLDDIAEVAKKCPNDAIEIGGHTDSIGSSRYNEKLSASRANAVKAYLVGKDISTDRLKAVGYGEIKPISDNSTEEGRLENRRIEFNIIDIKDVENSVESLLSQEENNDKVTEKSEEINFDDIPLAKLTKLDEEQSTTAVKEVTKEVEDTFEPISQSVWKRAFSCQEQFQELLSKDKIHFSYNKAEVSPKSYSLLNNLSKIARSCNGKSIYIGGHTDSDGDDGYNKRLSQDRAEMIKKYFIKRGVSSDKLIAVGYGETRPIASNDTDSNKAKNRRIEFYVKGVE